jgi:hypothetical protein
MFSSGPEQKEQPDANLYQCVLLLQIYALGFVSVYDQILEALPSDERDKIFTAYLAALGEDAAKYRRDANKLEQQASALSGPDALTPDNSGSELQVRLMCRQEAELKGAASYAS